MRTRKRFATRELVFFVPDIHFPHQDKELIQTLLGMLTILQPERIVFLGDIMDCYDLSSFDQDPCRLQEENFLSELQTTISFLEKVREICPDAIILIKEGNHEDRLRRHLWRNRSPLAGLPCLQWPKLLELERLNISWFGTKQRCSLHGLTITHGQTVRQQSGYTAHAELRSRGTTGISGHTHRLGRVWKTDDRGIVSWIEAGCFCDLNPEYGGDKAFNWQHGIVIGEYYKDQSREQFDLRILEGKDKSFIWNGVLYTPDGAFTK